MAYTVHNFEQGDVLYAEQLNEMDAQIAANEESIENSVSFDMLAEDYSANKTYSIGDYVIHDNELYTCIYEITAYEGWNPEHWRIANLGDGISDLNHKLSKVNETVYEDIDISDFTWESGTYNATTGAANSTGNAIRLVDIPYALKGSKIYLYGADSSYSLRVLEMKTATLTGSSEVLAVTNGTDITTEHDGYLRIVLIKSGINGDTTKASYVVMDLIGNSKIDINANNISAANSNIEELYDISGYVKPNLINAPFIGNTIDGVTYTVNSDWSVRVVGTNTRTSGGSGIGALHVILPTGKYILTAFGADSTAGPYVRLLRSDNSNIDCNYNYPIRPFEITSETEDLRLYIRTDYGQTVDSILYPMIRSADVYNDTYAKYGEYAIYKPIQKLIDYTKFNWSGKKMNALGDSIVKGSNGNFIDVIGGILNLSEVRNYGIGGSRIASSDIDTDYPPACTRYVEMNNDADIILVHAGTNDYTGQIPLGETNSTDITTWNGALNVLMTGLRDKYPTALIIFSNILDRIQDNNPDRYPIVLQTYRDALEAACRRNHIVFYNGYKELGFDFHKGYYDHYLTVDGLHPNQTGANIMGRSIAGFIKWH